MLPRLLDMPGGPDRKLPEALAERRLARLARRYRNAAIVEPRLIAQALVHLSPSSSGALEERLVDMLADAVGELAPLTQAALQLRFIEGEEDAVVARVLRSDVATLASARAAALATLAAALLPRGTSDQG